MADCIINHNSTNVYATSFANGFSFIGCNFEGGGYEVMHQTVGVAFQDCVLSGDGIIADGSTNFIVFNRTFGGLPPITLTNGGVVYQEGSYDTFSTTNVILMDFNHKFTASNEFSGLTKFDNSVTCSNTLSAVQAIFIGGNINNTKLLLQANSGQVGDLMDNLDSSFNTLSGIRSNGVIFSSSGFASSNNVATVAISATGITNTIGSTANAYLTCTSVTSYVTNAAGFCILTNTTATYNNQLFRLQNGGCIHAASGLSGTLTGE